MMQCEAEFQTIDHLLGQELLVELPSADREGTLLLVTADHGQIHVPQDHVLSANDHPALNQHLMVPVVGESREAIMPSSRRSYR
jgi:hypothetical protein